MGNPYPVEITDIEGEVRLTGTADFTDPANQPSGPGGLFMPPHAGSPQGAVIPTGIGYLIIDTTTGALWQAVGATNTDWVNIGGNIVGGASSGVQLTAQQTLWRIVDSTTTRGLSVDDSTDGGTLHSVTKTAVNTLDDGTALGSAKFLSGAGFWNHAAPGAQPATPVLLADVIAVLQAYGLCS
jgi:hypothetical protein